jgi:hypothetical protein
MDTRPPLLEISPKVEHLVLDLVREGVSLVDIARGLNIGERSLRRWLAEGRHDGRGLYCRFARGYNDAQLERQMIVNNLLQDARRSLAARPRSPRQPADARPAPRPVDPPRPLRA